MEPIHFSMHFASDPIESGDNRVIGGLVVPFDKPSKPVLLDGVPRIHSFTRGAFARTIKERLAKIRLHVEHEQKSLPVGKALEFREEGDGLHSRFEIANTSLGNDALTLVRDDYLTSFSVGISPIQFREEGERIIHLESRIDEVSLVSSPAFEGATAQAFSTTASSGLHPDIARRRLRLYALEL